MSEKLQDSDRYQTPEFFYKDLGTIPEPFSHLLEHYSGIPPASQKAHILAVRNTAWQTQPYPCLGRFRFLNLDLSSYPLYSTYVLPTLKGNQISSTGASSDNAVTTTDSETGPIFLDLGTCLGQDLRKLLLDGVPASRLYGSDIVPEFIEAGHALFKDSSSFPRSHFLCPANVFPSNDDTLAVLHGKVDILHVTAVFHLFGWEQQQEVARRCLRLLKKDTGAKVLVLGAQVGNFFPQENNGKYRHNEDSWRRLWEGVVYEENEWRGKVKGLEVNSVLERVEKGSASGYALKGRKDGSGSETVEKSNRAEETLTSDREGLAKHLFWVWVEFSMA